MIVVAITYVISIAIKTIKLFSFLIVVNLIFNSILTIQQSFSIIIDFQLKIVLFNDIIVYNFSNVVIQLVAMINKFFII